MVHLQLLRREISSSVAPLDVWSQSKLDNVNSQIHQQLNRIPLNLTSLWPWLWPWFCLSLALAVALALAVVLAQRFGLGPCPGLALAWLRLIKPTNKMQRPGPGPGLGHNLGPALALAVGSSGLGPSLGPALALAVGSS